MKLTILGACSGTEPMPGLKHVSFVVEQGGGVYWFDAGEGCSRTGYLGGVDMLAVQAIFISHGHMDHIGGLANLLWTMKKLISRGMDDPPRLSGRGVPVFIPNLSAWQGVRLVVGATADDSKFPFKPEGRSYSDGVIFEDANVRVTALHNAHMGEPADGKSWQSFSFRLDAAGKSLVFSGDVRDVSEMAPILDGADLLLMETGHHKVEDICAYLKQSDHGIGRLGFIHHGRAVLADAEGELRKAKGILGENVFVAEDEMTLQV